MTSVREHEQGYRRGLVLGLTMAEIAILVIFVLLLVLGALLARQEREAHSLRQQVAALDQAAKDRDRIIEALGVDPDAVVRQLAQAKETEKKLVLIQKENERLSKLEQALEAARPQVSEDKPLPELFRELVFLRDAVVQAGVEPTAEAASSAISEGAAARASLAALTKELEALNKNDATGLARDNERLAREIENLKSQMANLRAQARAGGRGLDHPPCWATPEGRAEYIFDVALTSGGLIVRDRALPHRAEEQAALPIAGIAFDHELATRRFLAATAPLYQWSVEHECRFVVRAFDITGPTEKLLYKQHMRVLEQHFYKYEELTEPFRR